MKTKYPFHSIRTRWVTTLLVSSAFIALTLSVQAANPKAVLTAITLDDEHTSIVDRLPTGEGGNEFRGDGLGAYTHGGKIQALLGGLDSIWLDGNTSGKVATGRTAFLDLQNAFECLNSVNVDVDGNPGCDPCFEDPRPFLPEDDFAGLPDDFFLRIFGWDYDNLQIGCALPAQASARLEFEIAGLTWVLHWGPHDTGHTYNPESPAIEVTRSSSSEWRFQTTGDHRATLYRRFSNYSHEYHGQYAVKFSGIAVALPGQPIPAGTHCGVIMYTGALECTP